MQQVRMSWVSPRGYAVRLARGTDQMASRSTISTVAQTSSPQTCWVFASQRTWLRGSGVECD